MFPLRLAAAASGRWRATSARCRRSTSSLGLAEALPTGLYSGEGIERYVRRILSDPDRTDDFRLLRPELYLAATDLDTCERVVFGAEGWDDVPISRAVSASSALPMIYKPVKIKDREYVDGGIVSTTNLDIAVEAGAKFIVVVNPLVPYINDFESGSRRSPARGRGGSRTWASRRSATRRSSCSPTSACTSSPALGGALPGRRHHPDRARAHRRADVPDERHELHLTGRHRPARVPVGDAASSPTTTRASSGSAPGTGSRSRRRACARSSSTSRPSASRPGRGARSSSRRPRRCCASRLSSNDRARRGVRRARAEQRERCGRRRRPASPGRR